MLPGEGEWGREGGVKEMERRGMGDMAHEFEIVKRLYCTDLNMKGIKQVYLYQYFLASYHNYQRKTFE